MFSIFLASCSKEVTKDASKGEVQFSLGTFASQQTSVVSDSSGGNDTTSVYYYYAMVTIENLYGEVVYGSKLLRLYSFSGQFISESLSLEIGKYKLTQFSIIKENEVLYVTPMQYSDRAQFVEHPLPIGFSVSESGNAPVTPEVLNVANYTPQAFGYISFDFSVIKTLYFNIAVYGNDSSVYDSSNVMLWANLTVTQMKGSTSKVLNYSLNSAVNKIEVFESPNYTLSINSYGYKDWQGTLSLDQIRYYSNSPLKVYLQKQSSDTTCIGCYPPSDSIVY
jgi:hypothetical protein